MRPKPPPIAAVAPEPPEQPRETPEESRMEEDQADSDHHDLFDRLLEPTRELSSGHLITYQKNHDGKPQVVSYNHDGLVIWGGIGAAFSRPSIFRLRKSLSEQVVLLLGICAASYFIMWKLTSESGTPKYWTKQMSPLFDLSTYLNAVVAFILGLFISLNLQRWWVLRASHLQACVKSTRNLVMSIGAILPSTQYATVREQMCRHALLSFRLLFMCARGPVTEKDLRELVAVGLLQNEEIQMLQEEITARRASPCFGGTKGAEGIYDFDIADIPLIWNARQVQALFKAGCFAPPCMSLLHGLSKEAQGGIDSIRMQLNSQLPFSYSHLIATLVQGAALLSAIRCGMLVALATSILSVVCQVFFCFCLAIVYLGLYSMVVVIADPFGVDVIDFPAEQIEHQLWKGCHLLECLRIPPVDATKLTARDYDMDDEISLGEEDDGEDGDDGDDGGD